MTFQVNTNSPVFEGSNSLKEQAGVGDFAGSFIRKTPITGRTWNAQLYVNGDNWDVSTASFVQSFDLSAENTGPHGLFFRDDGLKMYIADVDNSEVEEYDLSTAWDVSTLSFKQKFDASAQVGTATGVFFKPDGTKMYVVDFGPDDVTQYNLSTAWDVSTASFVQDFSVASQISNAFEVFFKPDGTKMYVSGRGDDEIVEYDLSTAWDLSSASFNQSLDTGLNNNPTGLYLRDDGLKLYFVEYDTANIEEYDLSTAWDVSTATFNQELDPGTGDSSSSGLFFKPDGMQVYTVGDSGDSVYEYELTTKPSSFLVWGHDTEASLNDGYGVGVRDVSGTLKTQLVRFSGGSPLVVAESTSLPASGEWVEVSVLHEADGSFTVSVGDVDLTGSDTNLLDSDGRYLHHGVGFWAPGGNAGNAVDAWTQELSVIEDWEGGDLTFWHGDLTDFEVTQATPVSQPLHSLKPTSDTDAWLFQDEWDVSTATFLQTLDVGGDISTVHGVFLRTDGLKMYILGNDDVYEYDLSTAWDVSTATLQQSFNVSGDDASPRDVFFKPDGSKMYMLGEFDDDVYEYDLSTAWDVSTASLNQRDSVGLQDTLPEGLFFRSDGKKMYFVGNTNDNVYEYDLSTAWDISTSSFNQSFDVSGQDGAPTNVFFRSDGLAMYIVGNENDNVYEYFLTTAWDVSTASFDQSTSIGSQDSLPRGLFFRSDGQKMYLAGSSTDSIHEYDLETGSQVRPAPGDTHEIRVWIANETLVNDGQVAAWWATNHAASGLPSDGYGVTIESGSTLGDGTLHLDKRVNGATTSLATQNLADNIPRETWLTLRITHETDGSFTVSLHDQSGTQLGTDVTATDTDHITNGKYDQHRVAIRNQLRVNAFDAWIIR